MSDSSDPPLHRITAQPAVDFLHSPQVDDVMGLCLSGGGYRAMLYHVGTILRLNEFGLLKRIPQIASVSGGSITAGVLALAWPKLRFDQTGVATNLVEEFAQPIIKFSKVGIDIKAVLGGFLPGRTAAEGVADAYSKHLFGQATLQDLPDTPRFTFMATNLETGDGWRFSKDYAADYRVGLIDRPTFRLARVVGASSAFPPFLSPARIDLRECEVKHMPGADLNKPPFTDQAVLTDGGVYDNLGLEPIWKRCKTILVSNAGTNIPYIGRPSGGWIEQSLRSVSIIQEQDQNLRLRMLFGLRDISQRNVAYWSIHKAADTYGIADPLPLTPAETMAAASIRTRLNPFTAAEAELLLKAGYAGADAAIRAEKLAPDSQPGNFDNLPSGLTGLAKRTSQVVARGIAV
jgi:NTE family protein